MRPECEAEVVTNPLVWQAYPANSHNPAMTPAVAARRDRGREIARRTAAPITNRQPTNPNGGRTSSASLTTTNVAPNKNAAKASEMAARVVRLGTTAEDI